MYIGISFLIALILVSGGAVVVGQSDISDSSTTQSQVMDASDVTWAHGVNSFSELEKELAGPVHFLEADISFGHLIGNPAGLSMPIMAHPPDITSDISLEKWLDIVITRSTGKGIKLDFKSIETVEPSLRILQKHEKEINFPFWLNADILPGPANALMLPVDADKFLKLCASYFPNSTLSVGWTTTWQPNISPDAEYYDWPYVRAMADILKCAGIEVNSQLKLTFPVRAVFASKSIPQLQWLLRLFPHSTLTIWSSQFDTVLVKDLLKLRKSFHISNVYYDVPEPLNSQFQRSKKNVTQTVPDQSTSSDRWWIMGRNKANVSCLATTYADDSTIVFPEGITYAVLRKDSFQLSDSKRLIVKGFVRFLMSVPSDGLQKYPKAHELVFSLADVSLFKKDEFSQLDTEDDTDVVWNALNTSRLYTFHHDSSTEHGRGSPCYYFKLDTSQVETFQVWKFPCNILLEDSSEENVLKHGKSQISSNSRLVLPPRPVMLGFVSSGDMQVVIHGLDVNPEPEINTATTTTLFMAPVFALISVLVMTLLL